MMNTTQSSVPTTLNTLLLYKLSNNSNLIGLDLYLIMFTTVSNFKNGIGTKHQRDEKKIRKSSMNALLAKI